MTTETEDQNENRLPQPIERRHESETWQSGEQDTSQVSVSSLPEDEKSEPTTATESATTSTSGDISLSTAVVSNLSEAGNVRVEAKGKVT